MMETTTKPTKKSRMIVIEGETWYYQIGGFSCAFWNPEGKKYVNRTNIVANRSWDVLERGEYKKTSDGMITPKDIRKYIQEHIRMI